MISPILPLAIICAVVAWWLRPGLRPSPPRRLAVLATALPSLAVGIAAVVFQLLHPGGGVSDAANICCIVGLGLTAAAILAAIAFTITGRKELARGAGFGACVAVFILLIEIFALEGLGAIE